MLTACAACACRAGMFAIIAVLLTLDRVSKDTAERLLGFFNPALNWVQRWLPLFYVPTLVVLPLAVRNIPGEGLPGPCMHACKLLTATSLIPVLTILPLATCNQLGNLPQNPSDVLIQSEVPSPVVMAVPAWLPSCFHHGSMTD